VVLDGQNCQWSGKCIGLPGVVQVGNRLAILDDAPGADSTSHMQRDVGLAWLEPPLRPVIAPPEISANPSGVMLRRPNWL
jgi:hypothetical protein